MSKFTRIVTLVLVAALLMVGVSAVTAQGAQLGPITQRVIDRGELICGVSGTLQGFSFTNEAGETTGFDADFCRAVAVAILGDANAVAFRPLIASERQAAMQGGEIDVMIRNTTWTLVRDTTWGAIFGPTTFYDGQGVGTLTELGVNSIAELDGSQMCVQSGTTTELNITTYVEANNLDIDILVFPDNTSTWDAFQSGACQSWTTDKSGIASFHNTAADPSMYMILPETISKEPLGPLSPQSDPQFADVVAWTVYAMIQAEEWGITSENVDDFLSSDNPDVQKFLGTGNDNLGNLLGIENDFAVEIVRQVGNYGEVYDRHIVPLGISRAGSVNDLWTRGGLLYSPPFK